MEICAALKQVVTTQAGWKGMGRKHLVWFTSHKVLKLVVLALIYWTNCGMTTLLFLLLYYTLPWLYPTMLQFPFGSAIYSFKFANSEKHRHGRLMWVFFKVARKSWLIMLGTSRLEDWDWWSFSRARGRRSVIAAPDLPVCNPQKFDSKQPDCSCLMISDDSIILQPSKVLFLARDCNLRRCLETGKSEPTFPGLDERFSDYFADFQAFEVDLLSRPLRKLRHTRFLRHICVCLNSSCTREYTPKNKK